MSPRMTHGRRASGVRVRATALLALAALVLVGCAGIPTHGPVRVQQLGADGDDGDLVTIAEGPAPGATPEQLLAGFLTAQRAPQRDYGIARDYLTDEFRAEWSPTARVLISDSPLIPIVRDETSLELTVSVEAIVDATGNYSALPRPETQSLGFDFAQNNDGEWRIASAPEGTLLSNNRFENTFGAFPLYFYDPSFAYLVPDVRWFPDTASRADRIVTELLRGQSPWYAGGVLVTAFPPETQLDPGVTIEFGTASVALSSGVSGQTPEARWRMQQQLVASLGLGDVGNVQITVGGFPLDVGTGTVPQRVLSVASTPLASVDGRVGFLSDGEIRGVPGFADLDALEPLGVTLGRDAASAAVRAADGVWLVPADGEPALLDTRAGLVDPAVDVQGYVWSAVAEQPGSIVAFSADGASFPVPAPQLDGAIVALELSRDSTRLLLGVQGANGPVLLVAGIVRDTEGVPVGLGEAVELTIDSNPLIDASWVDSSTIAMLSRDGIDARVDLYRIGGRVEPFGAVEGGVQLVGGNAADGIRVKDADGTLWRHNSSGGWRSAGTGVSFLGTQQ